MAINWDFKGCKLDPKTKNGLWEEYQSDALVLYNLPEELAMWTFYFGKEEKVESIKENHIQAWVESMHYLPNGISSEQEQKRYKAAALKYAKGLLGMKVNF